MGALPYSRAGLAPAVIVKYILKDFNHHSYYPCQHHVVVYN